MSNASSQTVHVNLNERSYDVAIGEGSLDQLGSVIQQRCSTSTRVMLAIDHNLPQGTVERCSRAITATGLQCLQQVLIATEAHKSASTHHDLLIRMAQGGLDRHDLVVALGGGIVGDIAGYAAATYMRGIRFIQCPTTLLSMVDASVGGKTGINLLVAGSNDEWSLLKNYAGCFWQPQAVLADISTLASLAPRHYRSGIAECIKHAMLAGQTDRDLFAWTNSNMGEILALDADVLMELVTRNVAIKARVVESDERETSQEGPGRAALNLGHTFAHAIEGLAQLSPTASPDDAPLLHGECVGLGLIAATAASVERGLASASLLDRVSQTVANAQLPTRVLGLPASPLLRERMTRDKKSRASTIRLILPTDEGTVVTLDDLSGDAIDAAWNAIRA